MKSPRIPALLLVEGMARTGPSCCRCGFGWRPLTSERASCGCVPLFCDPCRAIGTSEDHDTLTFDVWLADFGRACAEDALATHLDYAATWEKGVNPIDVKWKGGVSA